ncbi:hypothetical protein MKW98_027111 [Papaver atlanticum]|uniref:Uncharacterized protein n=1 Tax=Papaver atlanticum TaxID=357466 RepID=A0AAD4S3Y0_9MAGN|nr:hypothetical protein MKW98_027111 [Papaver atlanticum]
MELYLGKFNGDKVSKRQSLGSLEKAKEYIVNCQCILLTTVFYVHPYDGGFLLHCRHGKLRTGCVIATLLPIYRFITPKKYTPMCRRSQL